MAPKKNKSDKITKKYKLDLFKEVLPALDKRDRDFYDRCSEDEQKSIQPLVLMRWLSSVEGNKDFNEYYLLMVNDLVNVGFWDLYKHPKLQWMMLAAIGIGTRTRHNWIPMVKKSDTPKLDKLFRQVYPVIGKQELETLRVLATKESIKDLCRGFAMDTKETKPYLDELKKIK